MNMVMPGCPNPGACGFQPRPCVDCTMDAPTQGCPNATACALIDCFNCTDGMPQDGCPNPGACGFQPIPCQDCMQGMPMQGCPDADWCGMRPGGGGGGMMCMGCMPGMAMAMCPDPMACGYCMMQTTFYASKEVCLWFSSWNVTTGGEYFGVMLLLVLLAFAREWFSEGRVLSARRRHQERRGVSSEYEPTSPASASSSVSSYTSAAIWDALYYFITLTLGYLLMLAVMTYNFGLTVTVVLASAVGRFLSPFVVNRFFKKKS